MALSATRTMHLNGLGGDTKKECSSSNEIRTDQSLLVIKAINSTHSEQRTVTYESDNKDKKWLSLAQKAHAEKTSLMVCVQLIFVIKAFPTAQNLVSIIGS